MTEAIARKVAVYGRVSVDDGDTRSVPDQLADLHRWAKREGWTVVAELKDDGISASKFARGKVRDGWNAVVDTLKSGDIDALLTWEFSRATRDRRTYVDLAELCEDNGVLLGYGGRLYDLADDADGFSTDLQAALAVQESRRTSKRVKRAAAERARRGDPAGRPNFGYRRRINPITGRVEGWEIDPERADIVREAVRRVLAAEPLASVARDFQARDIRGLNGHLMTPGNLGQMIRKPVYAGLREHHGETLADVRGTWPALISEQDHYRLLRLSAEKTTGNHHPGNKWLGSGIFRCGRDGCDGTMRVHEEPAGPNRKYPKAPGYSCQKCTRIRRKVTDVHSVVEPVIVGVLSRPDALEALTPKADLDRIQRAQAHLDKLRAEKARATRRLNSGEWDDDEYAAWKRGWRRRFDTAARDAKPVGVPDVVAGLTGPNAAELWKDAPLAVKREALRLLTVVTILPQRTRRFDPETVVVAPANGQNL